MTARRSHLAELGLKDSAVIEHVGGARSFRRRLMELGLVPGTRVELVGVAPLGDPLELLVRGASLSIRRTEAAAIRIAEPVPNRAPRPERDTPSLEPAAARGGP